VTAIAGDRSRFGESWIKEELLTKFNFRFVFYFDLYAFDGLNGFVTAHNGERWREVKN
jgi:hypothetical protein